MILSATKNSIFHPRNVLEGESTRKRLYNRKGMLRNRIIMMPMMMLPILFGNTRYQCLLHLVWVVTTNHKYCIHPSFGRNIQTGKQASKEVSKERESETTLWQ